MKCLWCVNVSIVNKVRCVLFGEGCIDDRGFVVMKIFELRRCGLGSVRFSDVVVDDVGGLDGCEVDVGVEVVTVGVDVVSAEVLE
ncbi:hypothetical protein Tco_0683894 [Tanacetum coccineum]